MEAILEHMEAMHEEVWSVVTCQRRDVPTSRRPHVVTSQRRDVGSTNTTVNKQQRRDVATSQHRDVETSRRQREICPPSLKAAKGLEFGGIGRRTKEGTEFQSRSDTDFEEVPVICIVSHFLDIRMMFLRLNIFIFLFSMF